MDETTDQQNQGTQSGTPEGAGASETATQPDTLDALLKEFEPPAAEKPGATGTETELKLDAKALQETVDFVRQSKQQAAVEATRTAISETVKNVKAFGGDALANVPDKLIQGMLHLKADSDALFITAFNERGKNPEVWKRIEKAFAEEVAKEIGGMPNQEIGSSRQAVKAAVNGMMTKAPPAETPDFSKMNAHQIESFIKQNQGRPAA